MAFFSGTPGAGLDGGQVNIPTGGGGEVPGPDAMLSPHELQSLLVVVAVVSGLAQVPVVAYLRYYALLVLLYLLAALDLIPERWAATRTAKSGADREPT